MLTEKIQVNAARRQNRRSEAYSFMNKPGDKEMGLQLTAVAQNLEQALALVDTPVDYIRLGYPYCHPLAEFLWSADKLEVGAEAVIAAGKIPQFQLVISPPSSACAYMDNCLRVIKRFPQCEIVIGHWGALRLSLGNIKLAANSLPIYNGNLIRLLRKWGIRIISLPLKLDANQGLAAIISSSPAGSIFEYHLWGPVMASHWWGCPAGEGDCNPKECLRPVKFGHQQVEFALCGQSLWLTSEVNNLNRAQELAQLGIGRGLLQLPDLPPQAVPGLIDYCLAGIDGKS